MKTSLYTRKAVESVFESAIKQEQLGPGPERAITPKGTQTHVEKVGGHERLVRRRRLRDKLWMLRSAAAALLTTLLDFALPPRCAGCGTIVSDVHSFCGSCWNEVQFLGAGGCGVCGIPLEATEADTCGRCMAAPPLIARTRAAVAYGDIAKSIALRLKYGRKVALAKTMARFMTPLAGSVGPEALLVPVPLHRRRIWTRGFNQSALVAGELSKRLGVVVHHDLLVRVKATPPLKGMSLSARRRTVQGAFRVAHGTDLAGRTIVLVDDVLTTGSTSEACAKALLKAGAARVELISWARVIRASQL